MNLQEIKESVAPICSRYGVRRLDLFGSYARGEQHDGSDIDFCVSFQALPPAEYAKKFFGLLHDLEDSLHASIDLLTVSSIKKPSLRNDIAQHGICVYGQ
ncbi:MAG: nucleotidyltransferase domain-containing protein [Kiritimatiellales bacterium]|nr:nucleotidyltransferase domain-containing protein [Kiritimatiellales bacterium]MCF7863581.1 nucleotidyltransferase domain-containing protein [Kiritimatiellales bacterium]